MDTSTIRTDSSNQVRSKLKYVGIILAIASLIWVLHDVHPRRMLASTLAMDWRWLVPAIFCDILSYYCQGWRWSLLLTPFGQISSFAATEAIYVGLFTNEIIPFRIGELVRTLLVSRRLGSSAKQVLPSVAVERLFDGFWMAVATGMTAIFIPLPRDLARAADMLGVIVVLATAFLFWVILRKLGRPVPQIPSSFSGRIRSLFSEMARGLQKIGLQRSFYRSLAASPLLLLLQALAFWFVIVAYGIHLSVWAAVAVCLFVRLGTMIPNTPANVGTYQFFCVLGLTLFGVEKSVAAAFSFVVFAVLTVPLWTLGFVALSRTGMTLKGIRHQLPAEMK